MSGENQQTNDLEELKKYQESLNKYYTQMIPLLKEQLEYEKLKTQIATERAKCKQAEVAMAQMGAPEPKTQDSDTKK